MRACLQELLKRLEEYHDNCVEAFTKKATVDAASAGTSGSTLASHLLQQGLGHAATLT
jgi:hypothetical protein